MKTTTKIMVSVFFIVLIVLMVGPVYAWDDDACSGGYPPIWQIFKKGKPVHWVDWKDNRRFAIYNSGTPNDPSDDMVLDKETGLVWERSPSTIEFRWKHAQNHCNYIKVGGRRGWRLPTIQELASLLDETQQQQDDLLLPTGHPFNNVQGEDYHSATTYYEEHDADDVNSAWWVNFGGIGGIVEYNGKDTPRFVWCVRGGQGVDPQ